MTDPKKDSNSMMAFLGTWLVDRINVFFKVRRYLKMVTQRWGVLAATTLLATGAATYYALTSPNIYEAGSKIGIPMKVIAPNTPQAVVLEELNNFYDTQLNYLTSQKVMQRVDDRLRDSRPKTENFHLSTRAFKGKGYLAVTVESTDFEFARQFAKAWAEEFVTYKNKMREDAIGTKASSTRQEIDRYDKVLESARVELDAFLKSHNIGSAKETGDAAQQRLDKLQLEYQEIQTNRRKQETKTSEELALEPPKATSERNPNIPKTTGETTNPTDKFQSYSTYPQLRSLVKSKQAERDRQASRFLREGHPYLQRLDQEILVLNAEIQTQLELIEERRQATIKSLRAEEESYLPIIEDVKKEVQASRSVQYEFERLKDKEATTKRTLDNLRVAETSLESTTGDEGSMSIISAGDGVPVPVKPNRKKIILTGLFFGFAAGLGIIYLLGQLDDRLELAEEIEAVLEQPILGQIPEVDMKTIGADRVLITKLDEHNMFSESVRGVRSAVMLGNRDGTRQILIISSAVPGDGKTTFTANFAVTLAIAGHHVLLVDADLRRGNIHNFFELAREGGFSEVLLGQEHWTDVVRQTEVATLQVVTSGKLPSNPGELLISPITRQFIDEARQSFDYVVFDCPPLTAIDDTFSLASLADGMIFVVRSGQTSMRFAKTALDAVKQRGAHLLGIVINGIRPDNPYYYYRNYYHAYYSTGQPGPANLSSAPMPATKMAQPKRPQRFASIEAEAKALKGELSSSEEIAAKEEKKTEQYRMRIAKKPVITGQDESPR